ncbi:MAG: T9SS type A sorting domain-containing protein, partial [Bacteroidia bacterium]
VKFYAKNIFEIGYDGYRVEYTTDTGNTWLPLATTTSTGWYDYANTSTGRPFPQNQAYFNATNSSYTLKSYNASALAVNAQVCFRFVFKSDPAVNAAGLALDDFEIVGPANNPLPVSLISFTGKRANKNNVELTWTTANELSNTGFELQRRFNWTDEFEPITFVNGKKNSNQPSYYLFEDNNSNHFNTFYRLKQIDNNGSFAFSDIISVNGFTEPGDKLVESILPAFAEKTFVLKLTSNHVDLNIFNTNGQLVGRYKVDDLQQINISGNAVGIYFFQFTNTEGKTQIEKVFVR